MIVICQLLACSDLQRIEAMSKAWSPTRGKNLVFSSKILDYTHPYRPSLSSVPVLTLGKAPKGRVLPTETGKACGIQLDGEVQTMSDNTERPAR
jgi:hypothetical protein